jgi:hypothetical protein
LDFLAVLTGLNAGALFHPNVTRLRVAKHVQSDVIWGARPLDVGANGLSAVVASVFGMMVATAYGFTAVRPRVRVETSVNAGSRDPPEGMRMGHP